MFLQCFCKKEALELFRQQLLKHGTYLLKSNRHISKTEFAEALEEWKRRSRLGCCVDISPASLGTLKDEFNSLDLGFSGISAGSGKTKRTYAQNFSILRIRRETCPTWRLYSKFSTNLRDAASGSDNTYST